jgi:hypothetical protein
MFISEQRIIQPGIQPASNIITSVTFAIARPRRLSNGKQLKMHNLERFSPTHNSTCRRTCTLTIDLNEKAGCEVNTCLL